MIKISMTVILLGITTATMPMQKKNHISEALAYSGHACQTMVERNILESEVKAVLETGYRSWDEENRGAEKFTERRNEINPLIVVLNRNEEPNVVVTAYRVTISGKLGSRKYKRN